MSNWRYHAQAVIQPIEAQARREEWTEKQFRDTLRAAYPFGSRANYPYKIWREEQNNAIRRHSGITRLPSKKSEDTNQMDIFSEKETS